MPDKFDHKKIEANIQKKWEDINLNKVDELKEREKKFYSLYSFPYPSGSGLHVGHAEGMVANDIVARFHRMNGANSMLPMGWDSFGLPAENYAIKTGVHPKDSTENAVNTFIEQINNLGIMVDWEKEVGAHRPSYYKWTQWFFSELYKHGLAYKAEAPVNWCPKDQTVLANEQVIKTTEKIDGVEKEISVCERCDTEVVHKNLEQWFFKITDYADRLIEDLEDLDWPDATKHQQVNWIGRSKGALINFKCRSERNEIFLATNNKGKVKRVKKLFESVGIDVIIKTPKDIDEKIEDVEEGNDIVENAKMKAESYKNLVTDIPIIGIDTALYIDGFELEPAKVKRNALDAAGKKENELTIEEIGEIEQKYYKNIADKNGGEVNAHFLDAFAIIHPNFADVQTEVAKRKIVITNKQSGEIDYHLPLNSIYKIVLPKKQKYYNEINEQEELEWLNPVTKILENFLSFNLEVFTTRPDTIFGVTFMVIAPEHELIKNQAFKINNLDEIFSYINASKNKTDLERTDLNKDKSGVKLEGIVAINPADGKEIPIYVADYVLINYGTGSIMAVPGHDERDFEFACKYNLDVKQVMLPEERIGKEYKSVVFQKSVEDGFLEEIEKLDKLKITVGKSPSGNEQYQVIFSKNNLDKFIEICRKFIKNDFWIDIIGSSVYFIFPNQVFDLGETSAKDIFEKCVSIYPNAKEKNGLFDMLRGNEFYKDYVFVGGDGIVINSSTY